MLDPKQELQAQKKMFKDNIEILINNGHIDQAISLIHEYEKIELNDVEIFNMKAIIQIINNDLDTAERTLWGAVEIDNNNKDTLFNLAYLYEIKGELRTAINFYSKLLRRTDDIQQKNEVTKTVFRLKMADNSSDKRFIVLSSCPWGIMLQRPHHIARALSKLGYAVEYVQPATKGAAQDSTVEMRDLTQFSDSNFRQAGFINIHSPVSVFHDDRYILDNYKDLVQRLINSANEEVIILCYFPSQINTIKQLTSNFKVVYECVDDHNDLEYSYWSNKQDREFEIELLDRADIVTTTSSALYLTKSLSRDNVFLSKNAVNSQDFEMSTAYQLPEDIVDIPSPRVCYVGAVDRWFDEELFYDVVKTNRDKSFVVIGPVREGLLSRKEDNLHLLGLKEHKQLKDYLHHMDVGIIPFKDDIDIIVNCDPIKMYEYVISGLPVVATKMPELCINKDYIKVSSSVDEFTKSLNDAVQEKIDEQEISEFIQDNTWATRAQQLLQIVDGDTQRYSKQQTIEKFQNDWTQAANQQSNPIVTSLNSLTYAENDIDRFYRLAKDAYTQLQISFTLNNYMYASLLAGNITECMHHVMNDGNIDNAYKAELLFLQEQGLSELFPITLLDIAKKYEFMMHYIDKHKGADFYEYALANFYYAVGNYNKSATLYQQILQMNPLWRRSALINRNMSQMLIETGQLMDSKGFKENERALIERYLKQHNHLQPATHIPASTEDQPRFSVVIPTRNNHYTLKYTLDTCLNQQFNNYEIIVGDNSDNDLTQNLIREINDSKIKYFKTDGQLAMTENFNFAISKANGEYILVLGSDDGLLLHALTTLDTVLYTLQAKVLHWYAVAYGWPDVKLDGFENYFQIPKTMPGNINHHVMNGDSLINQVIDFEIPYSSLPMLYCNAVIHRDVIKDIQEKTGSVFKSASPDVYSGFALAFLQQQFVSIDVPMSIGGSSGKSNGIAHTYGRKDHESKDIKDDFAKLNNRSGIKRYKILPEVMNLEVAIAEAFLTIKQELFPTSTAHNLNRKKLAQKSAENLHETEPSFRDDLQKIYNSLTDDAELKDWFAENYLNRSGFAKTEKEVFNYRKGFSSNGSLHLNLSEFGVTDVYGAAQLFRKVTGW